MITVEDKNIINLSSKVSTQNPPPLLKGGWGNLLSLCEDWKVKTNLQKIDIQYLLLKNTGIFKLLYQDDAIDSPKTR